MTLSSDFTFFYKWVVPLLAIGVLLVLLLAGCHKYFSSDGRSDLMLVVGPSLLLVPLCFFLLTGFWNYADEVIDGGDCLVVRRGETKESIALSRIQSIRNQYLVGASFTVQVQLRTSSAFGSAFQFKPGGGYYDVVDNLRRRMEAARQVPTGAVVAKQAPGPAA